jgi:protein-disulfide isomerase
MMAPADQPLMTRALRPLRGLGMLMIVAAGLSGCGGDAAQLLTTATNPGAAPGTEKVTFNPFSTDGETSVGGREVITNPTLQDVMQTGELPEMSWGSPTAPVTLIKYASLTCPYCKKFQAETYPLLKREYIDTGKVRFIIREFPIGKSSGTATVALRCAPPDKYLALYEKFMSQQAQWVSLDVRVEAIAKITSQVGVTGEQLSACLNNKTLVAQLNGIKERGRKLGIIGTPNFFLNARLIKSVVAWADLRVMIDAQLGGAAKTN